MAVRPPGKDRFVRIRSLGEQYEEEAIKQRILKQRVPTRVKPPTHTAKQGLYRGTFGFTLHKVTWKSLRALYYHYLRILRDAQARSPEQEPAPFAIREDVLSYTELREQVSFLHRNKLDTAEQVLTYREQIEQELLTLTAERKELHNEKRLVGISPEQKEVLCEKTSAITKRVNVVRKEIRICAAIYDRSLYLQERYKEARRQLQDELLYLGGMEQSTHEAISKLLGKQTLDMNTYSQSKGRSGNYTKNMQLTGRELMTPDEVRLLDNQYALLFIRGEKAVCDEKYNICAHPHFKYMPECGAPKYEHGQAPLSVPLSEVYHFIGNDEFELLTHEEFEIALKKESEETI